MKFTEIFYSVFWISAISIVWFYTDTFLHYSRLFRLWIDLRLEYLAYLSLNPTNYFSDFLSEKLSASSSTVAVFIGKLIGCPLCTTVWLSVIAGCITNSPIIIGPVYVLSLFTIFQIRNFV